MELKHGCTGLVALAADNERIEGEEWSFRIKNFTDIPHIDWSSFGINEPYEYFTAILGNPFYLAFYPEGFPVEFPLKDWVVEIPEKFRLGMEKRFNPEISIWNGHSGYYTIQGTLCEFCSMYVDHTSSCAGCPFKIFAGDGLAGCVRFKDYLESRCELDPEMYLRPSMISFKNKESYGEFLEFARKFIKFIPDM